MHTRRRTLHLEHAKIDDIPGMVEFVIEWLKKNGLDNFIFVSETAVDEAVTNIIKHAYSGQGGYIGISCEIQKNRFFITINDKGKKFDPASVPLPDVDAKLEDRRTGGLGIYMMRKMMDTVEYSFDPERGNVLRLSKYLSADNYIV
jgi:serine/threonine-protein kinase RsbW